MLFFARQDDARRRTHRLLLAFGLTVLLLVLALNLGLALTWELIVSMFRARVYMGVGTVEYPAYFFQVNTFMVLLLVLGGWWIEWSNLQQGGVWMARRAGAREVRPDSEPAEQRLCNVVTELSIAAGMKPPTPMVLARTDAINAFAAGWNESDAVLAVTHGALERLTREELQGLVAHELSHIREGDTRLNMHLAGMVSGLQMVFNLGQSMCQPSDALGALNILKMVPGFVVQAVGWAGWLAGEALKAAVSRQREFLADARAVQWTRSRDGIGGVLRKILGQQEQAMRLNEQEGEPADGPDDAPWHASVLHMLLASDGSRITPWLDTHPPLQERIRRIYGQHRPALPALPAQ